MPAWALLKNAILTNQFHIEKLFLKKAELKFLNGFQEENAVNARGSYGHFFHSSHLPKTQKFCQNNHVNYININQ